MDRQMGYPPGMVKEKSAKGIFTCEIDRKGARQRWEKLIKFIKRSRMKNLLNFLSKLTLKASLLFHLFIVCI